jgi:hypothetical protein
MDMTVNQAGTKRGTLHVHCLIKAGRIYFRFPVSDTKDFTASHQEITGSDCFGGEDVSIFNQGQHLMVLFPAQ